MENRNRSTVVVATLILFLSGCSDLRDIPLDVCGNQVLDVAEDCDGSSPFAEGTACGEPDSSNACFLICDEESGAMCPEGWGCGKDERCRRPAGEFVPGPGSPWRFPVESFGVGDVDGDGFADLIGNGPATITVRFGSADGSFDADLDVFTRRPTGPMTFADINGDGRTDVLVPIRGALSTLLGTAERNLESVAYAPFGGDSPPIQLVALPSSELNLVSPLVQIGLGVIAFIGEAEPPILPIPGGYTVESIAGRIPVGLIDDPNPGVQINNSLRPGRHSFALAFEGASSVWIISSSGAGAGLEPTISATIGMPAGSMLGAGGAHFADMDDDGALDLVVAAAEAGSPDQIAVAMNTGTGQGQTLEVSASIKDFTIYQGPPLGFPLAMADLSGDGRADFITDKGIFVSSIGGFFVGPLTFFRSGSASLPGNRWTSAAVGDFNRDGLPDAACSGEGADAVFVYIGTGVGTFNEFVIPTKLPPTALRAGDFDGDLITDIAFVEKVDDAADRISVIFGSQSGPPSEPVFMGRLGHVEVFEPAILPSLNGFDVISDLLVVARSDLAEVNNRSVALLEGSSSRRMISPFALPTPEASLVDTPLRVVVGSFTEPGATGDVIVVAQPQYEEDAAIELPIPENRLFLLKGIGEGRFVQGEGNAEVKELGVSFDSSCALWVAGDLDAHEDGTILSGTDALLGFDGSVSCNTPETSSLAMVQVASDSTLDLQFSSLPDDPLSFASDIELFDADLDGDLDMVMVYQGQSGNAGREGDGVVVYWHENGELVGSSPLDGAGMGVLSAAPMLFDGGDSIPELLVLARDGLYVSHLDVETAAYGDLEYFGGGFGYERFEVGDLNGDGLMDLALLYGDDVEILLSVPAATRGQELANENDDSPPEPAPQETP